MIVRGRPRIELLLAARHAGAIQFSSCTLTLLTCGAVWFGMWWRQRSHSVSGRLFVTTVLIAGLVVRLAYVFLTPVFYAPDEQSHFNYIKHLAENKSFPVQTSKLGKR